MPFNKLFIFIFYLIFSIQSRILTEKIDSDYEVIKTDINSIKYSGGVRWDTANSPITPKNDGGYYVIYYDKYSKTLHVLSFNSNNEIEKNFDTEYNYYAFDIITISNNGFAFYAKGATTEKSNTAILVSYNSKFKRINQVFEWIILEMIIQKKVNLKYINQELLECLICIDQLMPN